MKNSVLLLFVQLLNAVNGFTPFPMHKVSKSMQPTILFAENGPPKYDKIDASLREAEIIGQGSVMLHIETTDKTINLDYKPGHVIALEIKEEFNSGDIADNKNSKDASDNEGWMRGPYTVSRSTDNSIDVLVKVVGDKTNRFASAVAGTAMRFGGRFHVPILEGVQKDEVNRVVMISTGTGVGPCVGAIENALDDVTFPPIELFASYRNVEEILYRDYLNKLHSENSERFAWKAIVSSDVGRLSASEENLNNIVAKGSKEDTHFHLIGNGQMVNEFKAGLTKAGISKERVTIESYFNHKAPLDNDVVERIAGIISSSTVPTQS